MLKGELDNAYSLSRPPGHHCLPINRWGSASWPIFLLPSNGPKPLRAGKVAVIDWDVHHGNGTQHIYWQRDDVLTLSLHQDGCSRRATPANKIAVRGPGEGL